MSACYNEHLGVCHALLHQRADVDLTENQGFSALHFSASRGNAILVQMLLRASADTNRRTHSGMSALHFSCKDDKAALTVTQLLSANANIEATDGRGWTPLHVSCRGGVVGAVKELLRASANLAASTEQGEQAGDLLADDAEHAQVIGGLLTERANSSGERGRR
jgi:ankyrin